MIKSNFKREVEKSWSPVSRSSPSHTPVSPTFSVLEESKKEKWYTYLLNDMLYSRRLANKIIFSLALVQATILTIAAYYLVKVHLWNLSRVARDSSFHIFFLNMIPGLIVIPLMTALLVWPSFVIIGSFRAHWTQDLDTLQGHLVLIRKFQAFVYSLYLDSIYREEAVAFRKAVGSRLSNDIITLILEKLKADHDVKKIRLLAPLQWTCKLRYQHEPSFKRALHFWALFTGIHESYGIPSHWPLQVKGTWIGVFSRDGFILVFSCLFRYSLVIWLTR